MRVQGSEHRDHVVGALADRQYGVVTREQLLAAGVGRGAIARGVETGRLRAVFHGVYGRKHARITTQRIRLHPLDALVIDGLRVTTPSRTIVDLASTLTGRALREVVERAQDLRRFDRGDIEATMARAPRRPGRRRLVELIALMSPDADNARSHLARLFRVAPSTPYS